MIRARSKSAWWLLLTGFFTLSPVRAEPAARRGSFYALDFAACGADPSHAFGSWRAGLKVDELSGRSPKLIHTHVIVPQQRVDEDPSAASVDVHHPQCGQSIAGKVLLLKRTSGSTNSPGALLEAIRQGNGPAAIVLDAPDMTVTSAAFLANELYGIEVPVTVKVSKRMRP